MYSSGDDGPVPAGMSNLYPNQAVVEMKPGDNILEAMQSSMLAARLRVVDFGGGMTLVRDDWVNPHSLTLDDSTSVVSAPRTVDSRENTEYYLIVYSEEKTKPGIPYYGTSFGTGFVSGPAGAMRPHKVIRIDAPAPWVTGTAAEIAVVLGPMVDRLRARATSTPVEAVARYDALPRASVAVGWDGDTLTGIARRVTFTLATRRMTIELREVVVT